ncbi:MAG: NUDIX domain-containing protein [Cyanobacteria bacterium J06650_10]
MVYLDVLAWICIYNKRILCARTKGNDIFYLPGGKRKPGESNWEGISREVKEELNVALIESTLKECLVVKEKAHGFVEPTWVEMRCFTADYVGEIMASSEIEEIAWFQMQDIDKCAPANQRVLEFLGENQLID